MIPTQTIKHQTSCEILDQMREQLQEVHFLIRGWLQPSTREAVDHRVHEIRLLAAELDQRLRESSRR